MSESKNHEPFMIPTRNSYNAYESGFNSRDLVSHHNETDSISFDSQFFAEIEIDSVMDTPSKSTPIPHPIHPAMDEKRRIFNSMRELSWSNHSFLYENSKFYNRQTQIENSRIFYKQAIFMKDFEDDFTETFPFSAYFPYYQLMSYEQLRTYFTWRTKVRNGYVGNTSLSYVFVYIYELLNNIGVSDPVEGLNEIMSFWNTYKFYDTTFEKYLMKWIKDYHIYYRLPMSFQDFLYNNKLQYYYPEIAQYEPDANFDFEYLSGISIYKIKQSSFYNDKTSQLVSECFHFIINNITDRLKDVGIVFKDLIMQCFTTKSVWTPFRGALFYPTLKQPDRKVILSDNEVYVCSQNTWFVSTISATSNGKHLIGYILKQMEAVLRKVTNYKHKLSANLDSVNDEILQKFIAAGISLEKLITDSVLEFYREKNKIIITVNKTALDKIRLEALDTQEKLIIPENNSALGKISHDTLVSKGNSIASKDDTTPNKIRSNALNTQRKLIIPMDESPLDKTSQAKLNTQEKLIIPEGKAALDKISLDASDLQERLILSEDECILGRIETDTLDTQERLILLEDECILGKVKTNTLDTQERLILSEDECILGKVKTDTMDTQEGSILSDKDCTLGKIKLDTLDIQEKMTTPTGNTTRNKMIPDTPDLQETLIFLEDNTVTMTSVFSIGEPPILSGENGRNESPLSASIVSSLSDGWTSFKNALNEIEINALKTLLQGNQDMKQYANAAGIMLEVLADSINEKAFDHIGDNILELDDSMILYDEYREKIMIMVG